MTKYINLALMACFAAIASFGFVQGRFSEASIATFFAIAWGILYIREAIR